MNRRLFFAACLIIFTGIIIIPGNVAAQNSTSTATSSSRIDINEIKEKTTFQLETWRNKLSEITISAFDKHESKRPEKESAESGNIAGWSIVMGLLHIAKWVVTTVIAFYVIAGVIVFFVVKKVIALVRNRGDNYDYE
ncbi:MAG: hypothetical protein OEX08_02305 [Candidatus Nomurabacteria bacterium]|nr:hypothetical protein [Candidatus Nomurabacteria bacterium]